MAGNGDRRELSTSEGVAASRDARAVRRAKDQPNRATRRLIQRNRLDISVAKGGDKKVGLRRVAQWPSVRGTIASLAASAGIGTAAGAISFSQPASAQGTFPGYTASYYIDNLTALHSAGCLDADAQVSGDRNVILDFGTQVPNYSSSTDKWGTLSPDGPELPDNSNNPYIASVESATTTFILGWLSCKPNLQGWIGVGTNDSVASNVNATSGHVWGEMIKGLHGRFASTPITVRGADDIEFAGPGSHWPATFAQISDWIGGSNPAYSGASSGSTSGYQGGAGAIGYFDYGSANGCEHTCSGGYTWPDVYNLASGYYDAIAMPQDYYPGMASDWLSVENHASYNSYKNTYSAVTIPFSTVMTENGTEYTPQVGWSDFTTTVHQYSLAATNIAPMT